MKGKQWPNPVAVYDINSAIRPHNSTSIRPYAVSGYDINSAIYTTLKKCVTHNALCFLGRNATDENHKTREKRQ